MAVEYPVPDEGEIPLLRWLVSTGTSPAEDLWLRLFSNDYTPARNSTLADYVTASFGGYVDKPIARASGWDAPTVVGHVGQMRRTNPETWVVSAPTHELFGAILFGGVTGLIYYQRRFGSSVTPPVGDTLAVRVTITLQPVPVS